MSTLATEVLLTGRGFLEAPHWRAGEIWSSDLHRHEVIAVDPATASTRVVGAFADQPSGLGWRPDGSAVVVLLVERKLVAVADGRVIADLTALSVGGTNDMVVDDQGRSYVGTFGYDVFARAPYAPGNLILVDIDGSARVVADDLAFPNGLAITDDRTLLVAETRADRIVAFDIAGDGSLSGRRVWADLPGRPDGITLDRAGATWVALPREGVVLRVEQGSEVTDTVTVTPGWRAVSCGLGGADGRILYVTTAQVVEPSATAAIEFAEVAVPGRV
jgi:sugar lactone lactonase YvrE